MPPAATEPGSLQGMAPLKLNFRRSLSSRSTSQESTDTISTAGAVAAAATVVVGSSDCSEPQVYNQTLARRAAGGAEAGDNGNLSPTITAESNSKEAARTMEFDEEELARSDRSALLHEGAYYQHPHTSGSGSGSSSANHRHHGHHQNEQIGA